MSEIIQKAKELAEKYHKGQIRHKGENKEEIPYSTHPIGVAQMVSQMSDDEELIAAAYLHDVIEGVWEFPGVWNLDKVKQEIGSLGSNLLSYVEALSHDKDKEDYIEYVTRISKDEKLRIIKICDMIYNVTESPDEEQKERYREGLMILFKSLIGVGEDKLL